MKIVVCGIGNTKAGDDGFGPQIVNKINETDTLKKIDCGSVPENYLNKIVNLKPELVIFFDTIRNNDINAATILKNDELLNLNPASTSTHSLPFSSIYMFLKTHCQADIMLVGIRARSYHEMSLETSQIVEKISKKLNVLDSLGKMDIMKIYEILSNCR